MRTLPRVIWSIRNGLQLACTFADKYGSLLDWIGTDNAVQGHVKAALKLADPDRKNPGIGGQAFFLSDGHPVSVFDYLKPIYQHFGQPLPTIQVPLCVVRFFVLLIMWVQNVMSIFSVDFVPIVNYSEFRKTAITHFFSIDKARKHLGYDPVKPNDLSEIIESLADETRYGDVS